MVFLRSTALVCAVALVSCRSPREEAMRELGRQGVEANGRSLLKAVEEGEIETLRLLMQAGVYSGRRDAQGATPLHVAIGEGRLDAAWALVDGAADLDAETPDQVTPLALALAKGEAGLVDHLLDHGAQPTGLTPDGERVLPWAIRNGRSAFVRRLMESGEDPHQTDLRGTPLLHVAMEAGKRELMTELVARGADCGATNADGESVLVVAMRNGWRGQLGPLVRGGADPNLPGRDGLTPFEIALKDRDHALIRELKGLGTVVGSGSLESALVRAYERRDREEVGFLLGLGADPSPSLESCLVRRAAADNETDYVHRFLGYCGAPEGLLYDCCRGGRAEVAALLLAHGANPNPSRAPFLDTPLGAALVHGGDGLARRLLEARANPAAPAVHGQQPLQVAVALGRAATVRRLLEYGVSANAEVKSPVSEAFQELVRGKTMRWLLRKDSRITPLMLAVDSGSLETTRVLLEYGAEIDVWTRGSRIWPINLAGKHEDVKMMRLLLGKDPHVEERHVVVDLSDQKLRVFSAAGEEIYVSRVSTGKKGYETPLGQFAITNRHRSWNSTVYHSSMPYFQRLSCSDFGFHQGSVPSYPASHGCIRLPAGNASKLFKLTRLGDRVRIQP